MRSSQRTGPTTGCRPQSVRRIRARHNVVVQNRAVVVATSLVLAVSCERATGHLIVEGTKLLRQAKTGDTYPAGLGIGQLAVQNGCVAIDVTQSSSVAYVVWPSETELRTSPSGLEVVGSAGDAVFIGGRVALGGVFGELDWIDGLTADNVPDPCRTSTHESYFLAAPGSLTALLPPS
jgi:hypothetical protein